MDCGYNEASALTQYSAGSFAQPIRRVFATLMFHAREKVVMPVPTDTAPAQFTLSLWDPAWDLFYAPVSRAVGFLADRLNPYQFLTIRRYLGVVFVTLVILLRCWRYGHDRFCPAGPEAFLVIARRRF